MRICVDLVLQVGIDGLTESPLVNSAEDLETFIRTKLEAAAAAMVTPPAADGKETVVLAAKAGRITVLTENAKIGDRSAVLFQHTADKMLSEIGDMVGVICIPIWAIDSDQLPSMLTVVRENQALDQAVVRMRGNECMAKALRQNANMYPEIINGLHRELQAAGEKLRLQQTENAAMQDALDNAGAVAGPQVTPAPVPGPR